MNSNFQANNLEFMERYGKVVEILTNHGGYDLRERVRAILDDLNIKRSFEAKVSTLSGGETMRLALAKLLITNPDLLLLDEPTNHLDLQGNLRLRDFLQNRSGGYLIVSHDRDLLDEVTTSTLELEKGKLRLFGGNYSFYQKQREIEAAALEREVTRLSKEKDHIQRLKDKEKELAAHSARKGSRPKDHDSFQAGFFKNRAGATTGKKAQELEKRLESASQQLESIDQGPVKIIRPDFKEGESYHGKSLIMAKNFESGYDDNPIVKGVDLEICFGDKIALFGNNGVGKTTLIKGLVGNPDVHATGEVYRADNLSVKILDQNYQLVDRNKTILENMQSVITDTSLTEIRKYLARFLFTDNSTVNKLTGLLSGGEIARLAIAMIVAMPIDILILDEPTNNLDISAIDEIEKSLAEFEGAILIISHDLSFLREVGVDKSYVIADNRLHSLLTNPTDNNAFRNELLNYLQ